MIVLLNDEAANVRAAAASMLGKNMDRRSVEPLLEALQDSNKTVRTNAGRALYRINKHYKLNISLQKPKKRQHEDF